MKQFGVGLASAVLLAATLVLMLAPAVLTLLGRGAWWMPAVLGRIVPVIDIEGTNLIDQPAQDAPDGVAAGPEHSPPKRLVLPADPDIVSAARSTEQDVVRASDSGKGSAGRSTGETPVTPPISEAERDKTETGEHAPGRDPAPVGDAPRPPEKPR